MSSPSSPELLYIPQFSSPLADTQARRRSQYYKSRNTTLSPRRSCSSNPHNATVTPGVGYRLTRRSLSAETPQKTFLRERFQARCLERAQKKKERETLRRGWSVSGSEGSSEGIDEAMDCEDDGEDDETVMQDEVRVVRSSLIYSLSFIHR
jgi:hypothetical protein